MNEFDSLPDDAQRMLLAGRRARAESPSEYFGSWENPPDNPWAIEDGKWKYPDYVLAMVGDKINEQDWKDVDSMSEIEKYGTVRDRLDRVIGDPGYIVEFLGGELYVIQTYYLGER